MTKEEVNKRIEAINTIIEAQEKLAKLKKVTMSAIRERFNRIPHFLDEYDDVKEVDELEKAEEIAQNNTIIINDRIDQGATFEEIADLIKNGYEDENGEKHSIDYIDISHINFLNLKGTRTDLREDLMAYYYTDGGNYYTEYRDPYAVYSKFAQEAACRGMGPDELPAELLFDILFVDIFMEMKSQIRDLDNKDLDHSLIDYLNELKSKEHIEADAEKKETKADKPKLEVSINEIARAIQEYNTATSEDWQKAADIISKAKEEHEEEIGEAAAGIIGED